MIFLGSSAELGRESRGGNKSLLLFAPKLGHLGTVKAVVGATLIKSQLASCLCSQRPMHYW